MCGLVGIASTEAIGDRTWLAVGRDSMSHRGPDDAGEWWSSDGKVGFGHRRLSVIDLSARAHQPMWDDVERLAIIFNGEIYNHGELRRELSARGHVFRSDSDTEVLLKAYATWGESCLARLSGMFAFALYDVGAGRVFLARDRAGEKPFFYKLAGGALQFASELKALFANPTASRRIDATGLDCYLAMGFVPGPRCIVQGYNKLPPAHALSFNLQSGAVRVWRYWDLPESPVEGEVDENRLLDELETLLEDAVRRQMLADVPVGILLSGGVDSSLVTAMAARQSRQVRTFSIRFPGYGRMDETPHARLIARHFGTEHTELIAEPTTADLIPRLAQQFDEPVGDSSMIPACLIASLIRRHCTVALGGDGGDELFAGYAHYSRLLWMQRVFGRLPSSVRRWVANNAEKRLPVGFAASNVRTWLMSLRVDLASDLPALAHHFDAASRAMLMRGYPGFRSVAESVHRERVPAHPDLLQRATRMDFTDYLAEDLLVKVDRSSMVNSLEIRAPLLDHRLVEFAFGKVPSYLKATASGKKILLKRLAARILPQSFDKQRKQGFSIPLVEWLKTGPFRELFWDILTSAECLFDRRIMQGLLDGQERGYKNEERLFALVHFELWRRHYRMVL